MHLSATDTPEVVLITGAGNGIGGAYAMRPRRRAPRGPGHPTHRAPGRPLVKEIEAGGASVLPQTLDVADPLNVRSFVVAAHERYGRVDVLVNYAGVMKRADRHHKRPGHQGRGHGSDGHRDPRCRDR
jgi:NADP-dependent 3-hydroxy acid dehydrogenase YdfG